MPVTLQRGMILLTDIPEWDMPHEKFIVVLGESDNAVVGMCLINSKPNILTAKKNFQIKLSKGNYNFLPHDSFVDCAQVKMLPKEQINEAYDNKRVTPKGYVKSADMENIVNAGKDKYNMSLSKREKAFF